ncbi:MAG: L-lysine 6-transaminase [Thermoanaerobaculia bacterium]|nr:L-lysine 6-transaminase [Thermoanaerobaculia bacterium]
MTPSTETRARISPQQVHETLRRHMLTDGFEMVLDLEKSQGSWLFDSLSQREFLDFFTSFSSYPMGYNHPKMKDPEFRERILLAATMKPSNSDLYTTQMAEFVEIFSGTLPPAFRGHLFFISGGALAVENALKTAFDWKVQKNLRTGRGEKGTKVLHFQGAFHGRSGYTLSLTNTDPTKTRYFPKFDWPRVSTPGLRFPLTDEILAETAEAEERSIREIEAAFRDHPHEIAAIIIEPIQGEGGDKHFRGEFLRALRSLADENDALLIFDEIQTGFGTTGRYWCFEHFDVEPDLFAFGKKTQVCGIASSNRVDEVDSVFRVSSRINSTWGGNLVDMIRCQRFVEIIQEDELLANAADQGKRLLRGLRTIAEGHEGMTNARGRGLFVAFDLPDGAVRKRVLDNLREQGLLGLPCGPRSIRFRPPLVVTAEEIDEALDRVETVAGEVLPG